MLNIYSQSRELDSSYIVGSKDDLERLKESIERVLSGSCGCIDVHDSDMKPYLVFTVMSEGVKGLGLPYKFIEVTDIHPSELVSQQWQD